MAELNAKDREKLRSTQFACVDSKGGEHLPIHDESHVRNAMVDADSNIRRPSTPRRAASTKRGPSGA